VSFSPAWLALREPADLRARDAGVLDAVRVYASGLSAPTIVDLGSGTGSTLRALAPHLPPSQSWRLIDHDPLLLGEAKRLSPDSLAPPVTIEADLTADIDAVVPPDCDLLTCSALLDLVSQSWLERLVDLVARRALPFYAALSYDGRVLFDPVDPLDSMLVTAVNRHQRRDKGFGPALGPDAAKSALELFAARGIPVTSGGSDWHFLDTEIEVQRMLVEGWASAAEQQLSDEQQSNEAGMIAHWRERRLADIEGGRVKIVVGHVDLFALPPVDRHA